MNQSLGIPGYGATYRTVASPTPASSPASIGLGPGWAGSHPGSASPKPAAEPLARDPQGVLALEPRPERQRDVRKGPITDVLSRERVLVHLRPEIAWVDRDDADAGFAQFVRERLAQEIERRLAAPVAAPSRVSAARSVARDVHDEASRFLKDREACMDEREGCDDVDFEHASEDIERVIQEGGERGGAEFGGVVDEEIQTTGAADRGK